MRERVEIVYIYITKYLESRPRGKGGGTEQTEMYFWDANLLAQILMDPPSPTNKAKSRKRAK